MVAELHFELGPPPEPAVADLRIDEAPQDVLPDDFGSLTIRLVTREDRTPVEVVDLLGFDLLPASGQPVALRHYFRVDSDGAISTVDPAVLRDLLLRGAGPFVLVLEYTDASGAIGEASLEVELGDRTIRGVLLAPPSNPLLRLGGVSVSATMLSSGAAFETQTDADGVFRFEHLPAGIARIQADIATPGSHYHASVGVALEGDRDVAVRMKTVPDVLADVPPLEFLETWPPPPAPSDGGTAGGVASSIPLPVTSSLLDIPNTAAA
jgi:hypothetical protein